MSFSIIVAISENNAIGANNDLLWHISEDLKRFKRITTGHTIIMGKKTFESLPNGALPNRKNIVISDVKNDSIEGCLIADSIKSAIELCNPEEENFIIGGGSIYKQFLEISDTIYLTLVKKTYQADIFFPEIQSKDWNIKSEETHLNNSPPYIYQILSRKNQ